MRLRLIEEGAEEGYRWFAYVAPEGVPLRVCIQQGVHFPWPIIRSILVEYLNSKFGNDSKSQPPPWGEEGPKLDADRIWVDQAGRFALVDFRVDLSSGKDVNHQANPSPFIQSLALLGLPARHRLRRSKNTGASLSGVPDVQELPPMRALKLVECLASNKEPMSDAVLAKDLAAIDKNSHAVTGSIRFFASAVSLGLMSPWIFIGLIVLLLPSVILTIEISRELRCIKTLSAWSAQPQLYEDVWAKALDGARESWTDGTKTQDLATALKLQSDRFEAAYQNLGTLERFIAKSIPIMGETLADPPIYGSPASTTQKSAESDGDSAKVDVQYGNVTVGEVNFGKEVLDDKLRARIFSSVERSAATPRLEKHFPDALVVFVGIMGCVTWTTLTFGGIVQYFTGTCIARRDGSRLGFFRSFWRAIVFYVPLVVFAVLVGYCNYLGFDYLWLGTQLKRMFFILPVGYLGTILIWPRSSPLDWLAGTAMVPR